MKRPGQAARHTGLSAAAVPAARIEGLVTTEAGEEVLVYDQERHHIHHLNRTSAVIWRLCDGSRSVTAIALAASGETNIGIDETIVRLAIGELADAGLLARPVADTMRGPAQSRRVFMKRAAVAGAIAVPAIVSMTAPAAAGGASNSCGMRCTANSDCYGKCCSQCGPYTGPGYDGTICLNAKTNTPECPQGG